MSHNFFPMIARMRYIDRWGLMRNTQVENIQEHSHMVAVLAHALAVIQNKYLKSASAFVHSYYDMAVRHEQLPVRSEALFV